MSESLPLFNSLAHAADDAERLELLAAASPQDLERLAGALAYHIMHSETAAAIAAERRAHAKFAAALEAAADDAERLAAIEAARRLHGSAWLAAWSWKRGAGYEQWVQFYREKIA